LTRGLLIGGWRAWALVLLPMPLFLGGRFQGVSGQGQEVETLRAVLQMGIRHLGRAAVALCAITGWLIARSVTRAVAVVQLVDGTA